MMGLKERLKNGKVFRWDYVEFMTDIIYKRYAEVIPAHEAELKDGLMWYSPHFGIYHPKKPGKIRIVFDCSAIYMNQSNNK